MSRLRTLLVEVAYLTPTSENIEDCRSWMYETGRPFVMKGVGDVKPILEKIFHVLNHVGKRDPAIESGEPYPRSMSVGDRVMVSEVHEDRGIYVEDSSTQEIWQCQPRGWCRLSPERAELVLPSYQIR